MGQKLLNLYHGLPASAYPALRHQNCSDKPWEQTLCTLVHEQHHHRKIEAVFEPRIQLQEFNPSCYMPKFVLTTTGQL